MHNAGRKTKETTINLWIFLSNKPKNSQQLLSGQPPWSNLNLDWVEHKATNKKETTVGTIISTLPVDMNSSTDKHLAQVDQMEVFDPAVLNHLFEGLLNLDIKWYEAVSLTIHTEQ